MNGQRWEIVIPSPGFWLTSNNVKAHPKAQGRLVKVWRTVAYYAARATKPPTDLQRVRVDVLYRWAQPPVEEIENLRPTLKACVDGAIGRKRGNALGYGIVPSDSDKRLVYGTYGQEIAAIPAGRLALDPHAGFVVLTVTDLSGDASC